MKEKLEEKLEEYLELKSFIEDFNRKQMQKGLDLGARIVTDLVNKYPNEIGSFEVDYDDNYHKNHLVLRMRPIDNINGNFLTKDVRKYVLERYPDAKNHYLGIEVATMIHKSNIDRVIKEGLEYER